MTNGKIGVTTENIFPVIKKFLYSDHEIFLRELVSNAIDATQKLKTLAAFGDFKGELGETKVSVSIDKEKGTLTVSDHGIGMDAEDIDKYINQIAFSGAEEFLEKYKDTANSIIGHFGLGFYSAFMVADKVEIRSLSYKEGAKGVEWVCDGSPEYQMGPIEKTERGTDIILHIAEDSKEFLEQSRIDTLLKKYCRFLPVPVVSGKKQEWKDGKMVDTDEDNVVNATEPLWTKKPADLTDEDYLKFYRELMPGQSDPMFWIHLNVDYPFTLTGILYFPKVENTIELQRNRIQLYCNQVYVTDQVEGVVPEFMTLMQGVIDSPDIPLNVSRSYLQADSQVKKISGYISKKVGEKLDKMFRDDRKDFERIWPDIKIFIEYGMLTDPKFYDQATKFFLLEDSDGKFFTLEEYRTLVESEQTDKDGNLIYLYATDKQSQYSYIQAARDKGYSVLLMNGQLDPHIVGLLESKQDKIRFVRVDADIPERLIAKTDKERAGLSDVQQTVMDLLFRAALPEIKDANFIIEFEKMGAESDPVTIIQNEFMRRMKDMSAIQPGMSFYGKMPDSFQLVVNIDQPAVSKVMDDASAALDPTILPMVEETGKLESEIAESRKSNDGQNSQDSAPKADTSDKERRIAELRDEEKRIVEDYAQNRPVVKQMIDLALLKSGLLKGEGLAAFVKRSISLL